MAEQVIENKMLEAVCNETNLTLTAAANLSPIISPQSQYYLHAASSDNTRKAYRSDIRQFIAWGGLLPTTPDIVIRHLTEEASKVDPNTLGRRLTALKHWHTYQGFADPTAHPTVRKLLKGIKRTHGKPKRKAIPLKVDELKAFKTRLDQSSRLIDCRNRVLLLLAFFGAFRRSEVVAIWREHIRFVPEGIEIVISRSKTDQEGEGQICAIPFGNNILCPVTLLQQWLDDANIQQGPVFRRITKSGRVLEEGIKAGQVNLILKSIAEKYGLAEWQRYSGHSFRRGFATTASQKGASFDAIMRQGRWRHEGTVRGYIEEGKRFDANAAGIILGKSDNA